MENKKIEPITFNIDFDGSVVTHDFPRVGRDIGSVKVLKQLVDKGHRLILFTMRSHKPYINERGEEEDGLTDAINWFDENNIPLFGIQTNPTQHTWTESPKSYAQVMIDDSAIGCPLKYDPTISPRPFVDWEKVEELLKLGGFLD
jgi:hypothetical protein